MKRLNAQRLTESGASYLSGLFGPRRSRGIVRQRFADQIPGETANHNVLTQLRDFGADQFLDCLVRILNESLFEQANSAEKFIEFSFDNFVCDVLRFSLDLSLVNLALFCLILAALGNP